MKLYKVTITLSSSLITPLKGDTIWGHVVWGIANHEGNEAVQNFLEESKSTIPPFVVSSAFPKDSLCKPIPEPQERLKHMTIAAYSEIKKKKKERFCMAKEYIQSNTQNDLGDSSFVSISVLHNTINRITNTVTDGGLYTQTELWSEQKDFDLYIVSTYTPKRIKQLCEWAFENGYGADASIGKGNISISGEPSVVELLKSGKKYMALAPFILSDFSSVQNLRADTFIRTGKIGGSFVSSHIPWKKTVVLYDEGAVFESENAISFIGSLLNNIHADNRICQSGFAPVIPID